LKLLCIHDCFLLRRHYIYTTIYISCQEGLLQNGFLAASAILVGLRLHGKESTKLKKVKTAQTVSYFIAFVALGLGMAALGPTLPGLADQVHANLSEISYLFTARSFGFLLGSLFSGRFYDRLSGHRVMAAMIFAMSATMALMTITPTLGLLLAVMLALGTAEGALGVGGNALLVWVHQSRVAPFMNALHFFYGVGGFISPLIIARTLAIKNTPAAPYLVLAILILPAAAFLLRLPSPQNQQVSDERSGTGRINYKLVVLIALLLCLYIGAEVSYGSWIYSYVLKMNLGDENTAAYLTSVFWGSLTAGRLVGVPVAARLRPRTILLADLIGCFISISIAILWPASLTTITIATVAIGLSMASIYPTALTFAERRMPITGQVTGFLIVGGSSGGMIVPLIIGQMFESVGPRVMMFTILFDLILAAIVYLFMVFGSSPSYRTKTPAPVPIEESDPKPL
jgi:FHS family Na+ dependent glucose MFS transporter 1